MRITETIDARGLLCPLPVLRLRKKISPLAPGSIVELWADDPAALIDVPHFCQESGHHFLSVSEAAGYSIYHVKLRQQDQ